LRPGELALKIVDHKRLPFACPWRLQIGVFFDEAVSNITILQTGIGIQGLVHQFDLVLVVGR
jgi:hypothetical protein